VQKADLQNASPSRSTLNNELILLLFALDRLDVADGRLRSPPARSSALRAVGCSPARLHQGPPRAR
jgi:hypothetical protein